MNECSLLRGDLHQTRPSESRDVKLQPSLAMSVVGPEAYWDKTEQSPENQNTTQRSEAKLEMSGRTHGKFP